MYLYMCKFVASYIYFLPGYAIAESYLRRYETQSVECYVNTYKYQLWAWPWACDAC